MGKEFEFEGKEKKTPKSKKVMVTLDMDTKEVLSLDEEGATLVFDDGLKSFKCLLPEDVKKLSKKNRDAYFQAFGSWQYEKELEKKEVPDPLEEVKISPMMASATSRLEVEGKDEKRWHYCWKRTDTLRQDLAAGYVPATEDELATFNKEPGRLRKVGAMGEDELVLLKIPKEAYEAFERDQEQKAMAREKGIEAAAKRELAQDGGIPYDPKEEARKRQPAFGPPNPSSRGA